MSEPEVYDIWMERDRIPAKPEAIEIDGHEIELLFGFPSFSKPTGFSGMPDTYIFSSRPKAARQLSDWLTRYADWREAQDSVTKTP